jgi:photosystem II stability/assembly factor-like uncharacterized protein
MKAGQAKACPTAALLLFTAIAAHAQWHAIGPFGGSAELVRADPSRPGTVLAATRDGLLYRSTDRAASWTHLAFPAELSGTLHVLEIDPHRSGVWYVGIESDITWNSGLYRTTDAGATWSLLPGLKGKAIWSLAIWGVDAQVLAAGAADGVFLSRDGGETWRRISPEENEELRPVVALTFDPFHSDTLYAGTTHLPWRTMDGGATWQSIHDGMLDDSDVFSISVNPTRPPIVYASACSGAYRSNTAGRQWIKLATPTGAFRTYLVTLDPRHTDTVFAATSVGLLKSTNAGAAFHKVSDANVKSIAFDPSRPGWVYVASTTAGLMVSTDGGETLHESNRGFSNRTVTGMSGAGGMLYVSTAYDNGAGGLYVSSDHGEHLTPAGSAGITGHQNLLQTAAMPGHPQTVIAAAFQGLWKSADAGRTWTELAAPGDGSINALAAVPGKPDALLAGTKAGLFLSLDEGATWKPAMPQAGRVRLLQASAGGVAAVTDSDAFTSFDGGKTWTACGTPAQGIQWYGVALQNRPALQNGTAGQNGPDGQTVLAGTSHGLFRSSDGCRTWNLVTARGLDAGTITAVTANPVQPAEFFAVQAGRVWRSIDSGLEWQALKDVGQDGSYPAALLVLPEVPDRLFAWVPRRGVLSTALAH